MASKSVVIRRLAHRDIENAIDLLRHDGDERLALKFVSALGRAFAAIRRNPSIGSPRWAEALNLEGLRSICVVKFGYLVFYVERPQQIDVWRVLHERRDIPRLLAHDG